MSLGGGNQTTHENVIGVHGTIMTIVQAFGHGGKFDTLESHFLASSLDIATLAHMSLFDIKGGINKYSHHKQILFSFPAVARITISNKQNWNCDRAIIREVVLQREGDGGKEGKEEHDEDDEVRERRRDKMLKHPVDPK